MILLDTDHVVVLKNEHDPRCHVLKANLRDSNDQDIATTAVTIEEQMRGWLALINRSRDVHKQISAYARLVELCEFFSRWRIALFDEHAADEFKRLRKSKVRIGTQDLKIAAIALSCDALLLSGARTESRGLAAIVAMLGRRTGS